MARKIYYYLVRGLTKKGKPGEVLGSVSATSRKCAYDRLIRSGSVLDTPRASLYPDYYLIKKKIKKG